MTRVSEFQDYVSPEGIRVAPAIRLLSRWI